MGDNLFLDLNGDWISLTSFIQCVSLANMNKSMCQDTMDARYKLFTKAVEILTKCLNDELEGCLKRSALT